MAKKSELLKELSQHYEMWTQDNEKRMTRKNGWNAITDAYYGKLPEDWPYITRIVDPRIRTTLIEKNARLLNSRLRGTLVPRESADTIMAQTNNSILDYQWDSANEGGSMMTKMSICDMDARLYGTKFALVKWKYERDEDGKVLFDGNEFYPLDIRDCGLDSNDVAHIRDAKWFQHRHWEYLEDLEAMDDGAKGFKNVGKLKSQANEKLAGKRTSMKRTEYSPRVKQLRGLEDRLGQDIAYPVVKLVTEYREDRWITFAPDYDLIIRDIPNPYDHRRIPIVQLIYYPIQDDPFGESEVEPVLGVWRAIQATVCSYMDEVILKMRPPLKIIENAARIETIQYGPEAQWLMDRPDAVTEAQSGGDSLRYFETTYQALVASFNTAMGDLSQGISNLGPFEDQDKTATEIRQIAHQQNIRDQKNQNDLGEFIKDIMLMWLSNNQQFLFSDPTKTHHIIKIVGQEQFNAFKRAGLGQMDVPPEAMDMLGDIVEQNPDMSDMEIQELLEAASIPKHPVVLNPKEKDPTKMEVMPKMTMSDTGESADLAVVPEDLQGVYDYIPDVKSMSAGADETLSQARQTAIETFTTSPTVIQLLAQEGYRPNVKELLRSSFEGLGLRDADRFFSKLNEQAAAQTTNGQMGGPQQAGQVGGLPGIPQANIGGGIPQ